MRTITFDIRGAYAHFRKPYAPASPVTFPFPPPPTVLGMIGAILGLAKEEYLEALAWQRVRVGIRILEPVRIFRTAINLVSTKDGRKSWYRVRKRIQVPYEFIKDPAYRIHAGNLPNEAADELVRLLSERRTRFTPTLGLAQCLADVTLVAQSQARLAGQRGETAGVIPLSDSVTVDYEPGRRYERVQVPTRMAPDRTVHEYRQAVSAIDGDAERPIVVSGLELFSVRDETIALF